MTTPDQIVDERQRLSDALRAWARGGTSMSIGDIRKVANMIENDGNRLASPSEGNNTGSGVDAAVAAAVDLAENYEPTGVTASRPQEQPRKATGDTFDTLRDANIHRQRLWDSGNQISLAYRGNELAGEVGEACNVIKKLERERIGIRGSRATKEQLAEELADVVICADLIAMHEGIDLLNVAVPAKFNATSEKVALPTRLSVSPAAPEGWQETLEEAADVDGRLIADVERAARHKGVRILWVRRRDPEPEKGEQT